MASNPCRLIVTNVPSEQTSKREFEERFAEHGTVVDSQLLREFGFVEYKTAEDAQKAIDCENGTVYLGRRIEVSFSNPESFGGGFGSRFDNFNSDPLRECPGSDFTGSSRRPENTAMDRRDRFRSRSPHNHPPRDFARFHGEEFGPGFRMERPGPMPIRDPRELMGHEPVPRQKPAVEKYKTLFDPFGISNPYCEARDRIIDCHIFITSVVEREYAEEVDAQLKALGMLTEMSVMQPEIPLAQLLDDLCHRGVLFAVTISAQHALRQSLTINILHDTQQEYQNILLEDGIVLLRHDFMAFMKAHTHKMTIAGRADGETPTGDKLSINQVFALLADEKYVTVDELGQAIKFLQVRRSRLTGQPIPGEEGAHGLEGGNFGPVQQQQQAQGMSTLSSDEKAIIAQQQLLQQRILNILNKGGVNPETEVDEDARARSGSATSCGQAKPPPTNMRGGAMAQLASQTPPPLAQSEAGAAYATPGSVAAYSASTYSAHQDRQRHGDYSQAHQHQGQEDVEYTQSYQRPVASEFTDAPVSGISRQQLHGMANQTEPENQSLHQPGPNGAGLIKTEQFDDNPAKAEKKVATGGEIGTMGTPDKKNTPSFTITPSMQAALDKLLKGGSGGTNVLDSLSALSASKAGNSAPQRAESKSSDPTATATISQNN